MDRYLLDTNILVFLLFGRKEDISFDVESILQDFSNQFYTSSIAITELLQLFRIGKLRSKRFKNREVIVKSISEEYFIDILSFGKEHVNTLSKIEILKHHDDPFDHAIIAHAMTEKLTLISSDHKFKNYSLQGLSFVFNKR